MHFFSCCRKRKKVSQNKRNSAKSGSQNNAELDDDISMPNKVPKQKEPRRGRDIPIHNTDDLPLPSLEAFSILLKTNSNITIENFVCYFKLFVDIEHSTLIDHQRQQSLLNTEQFLVDLDATANRLVNALLTNKPYQSLFGDLVQFKEQLQVILGYYQQQIEKGQPIAKRLISTNQEKNSELNLMIRSQEWSKSTLDSKSSFLIKKHVVNDHADAIMKEQLQELSQFIMRPFLKDHSMERGFSYIRFG